MSSLRLKTLLSHTLLYLLYTEINPREESDLETIKESRD